MRLGSKCFDGLKYIIKTQIKIITVMRRSRETNMEKALKTF